MSDNKNATLDHDAKISNNILHKCIEDFIVNNNNISTLDKEEKNARNHSSCNEEDNAYMLATQDETRGLLFNTSSLSSESSQPGDGSDAGQSSDFGKDSHRVEPGDAS
eukprot:2757325-Ditylum_brightwellii.AAC.1